LNGISNLTTSLKNRPFLERCSLESKYLQLKNRKSKGTRAMEKGVSRQIYSFFQPLHGKGGSFLDWFILAVIVSAILMNMVSLLVNYLFRVC